MDESKPDTPSSDKQETEETSMHNEKHSTHNRETHGLRDDIDANTPIGDVKGPNVFERVKEEFEAIVEAIHQRKEDKNQDSPSSVGRDNATPSGSKHEKQSSLSEVHMGSPSKYNAENSEVKSETHKDKSPVIHHKETHGRGEDINADIPINEFKGPSIFHRAKEEIEALVDTIHTKKDSDNDAASPKKEFTSQSPVIHHKETHGRGEDINADVPISEFKGPSIFHRAKEEIEALVDTIHTKKDSDNDAASPKKEGGFRASIGKKLHRIRNRD